MLPLKQLVPAAQIASKAAVGLGDNFPLATLFYLASMAFSASQSVFGKVLYEQQPLLTPFQVLAYRALFSTLINVIMVNKNAKAVLWESIPTGSGKALFLRVTQLNLSIFITFYSIRHLELTAVAMVNNCATFVILILGWLLLSETVTKFTFLTLLMSFVGTLIVLLGGANQ